VIIEVSDVVQVYTYARVSLESFQSCTQPLLRGLSPFCRWKKRAQKTSALLQLAHTQFYPDISGHHQGTSAMPLEHHAVSNLK